VRPPPTAMATNYLLDVTGARHDRSAYSGHVLATLAVLQGSCVNNLVVEPPSTSHFLNKDVAQFRRCVPTAEKTSPLHIAD